jgi:radical SAM protein with 4Fe4S-binding SPASM domain
VDPEGRMSICVLSHRDTYDWRRGSLRDAWENFFLQVRMKPRTRPSKCDACRIQSLCGMCPANAELENGDAEKPVEFLCEVAHLRATALGAAVAAHGDCAFCPGGAGHAEVVRSAERIRRREIELGERPPVRAQLAILEEVPQAMGCGSRCGSCAAHS